MDLTVNSPLRWKTFFTNASDSIARQANCGTVTRLHGPTGMNFRAPYRYYRQSPSIVRSKKDVTEKSVELLRSSSHRCSKAATKNLKSVLDPGLEPGTSRLGVSRATIAPAKSFLIRVRVSLVQLLLRWKIWLGIVRVSFTITNIVQCPFLPPVCVPMISLGYK